MSNQTPFSARLESLREERGISKTELAKALHMDRKRVYRLINNAESDPPLTILRDMADFFSVSIDYLAGRTDSRDQILVRAPPEPPRHHFFNKRCEK